MGGSQGSDRPLVDSHTHVLPSAAASAAFLRGIGLEPSPGDGDVPELLRLSAECGIARTMIVPWLPAQPRVEQKVADGIDRRIATRAVLDDWHELNAWATAAVRAAPDALMCVVGLDPILADVVELRGEVALRLAEGAVGLKIAPRFLGVTPDDPAMDPFWQLADEFGVPVLSESGSSGYEGGVVFGAPEHFEAVLRAYPDVDIVLAHLGLGGEDDVARLTAEFPNLYADTSLRLSPPEQGGLSDDDLVALFRKIGTDRVLFGTNYPLVDQAGYADRLRRLPLTDSELEAIGSDNAVHFWGIPPPEPAGAAN
ncbi:MAG: hypothetical protein JWL73_1961 [Actinomycetia bacterium]|nr:hypothetical protein [Actinomycetes bacterium]